MNVKLESTNLISPLVKVIASSYKGCKDLLKIGLSNYFESQVEKYYLTNTFLHRHTKIRFSDAYFPLSATHKRLKTKFENLNDLLLDYNHIAIIGTAGSGKSMLMKNLFLQAFKEKTLIPIIIELRNLNAIDNGFKQYITTHILDNKVKEVDTLLNRALSEGKFLFLLDGYDEVYSQNKMKVKIEIESFMDQFHKNHFILSSRPYSGGERLPRFLHFSMNALKDDEILEFTDKNISDVERKQRIVEVLNKEDISRIKQYLKNPLLLSMFLLTFENHLEIPKKRSAFFSYVFDTLYSLHDGVTKSSFPRERKANLEKEEYLEILNTFSFKTFLAEEFSFSEPLFDQRLTEVKRRTLRKDYSIDDLKFDLIVPISIIVQEGLDLKFPHRSLQEYFAAKFIKDLPTDKKIKCYKLINRLQAEKKISSNISFWNLCKEQDDLPFTQHFLLPILDELLGKIDFSSDDNIFKSTLDLIDFRLVYADKYKHGSTMKFSAFGFSSDHLDEKLYDSRYLHITFITKTFRYFSQINHRMNLKKGEEDIFGDLIIKCIKKKFNTSRPVQYKISNFFDEELKDYLVQNKIFDWILTGVKLLKSKRIEYAKIINDEEDYLDQLIGEKSV